MGRKIRYTEYCKGLGALASKKKRTISKTSVLTKLKRLKEEGK